MNNEHDREDRIDANDTVRHGIDDNPEGDAVKGAALGGVGGAVVGAIAGMAAGPAGAAAGAAIGAAGGAAGSGLGVAAVDQVDNDNTVTGIGRDATPSDTRSADPASGDGDGLYSNAETDWDRDEKADPAAGPLDGSPGALI